MTYNPATYKILTKGMNIHERINYRKVVKDCMDYSIGLRYEKIEFIAQNIRLNIIKKNIMKIIQEEFQKFAPLDF